MSRRREIERRDLRTSRSPIPADLALFVQRNLHRQEASGAILLLTAIVSVAFANSPWSGQFNSFWEREIPIDLGWLLISLDLRHWINDGLMAFFFFQVGLEIKREIVMGELADVRKAIFPVVAAIGGMLIPIAIFLGWTWGGEGTGGWAVPMATDIAFALGVVALLGDRIPPEARVFLLTLATIDDIGSILVIAFVFTKELSWLALGMALFPVAIILLIRYLRVRMISPYLVAGAILWIAILKSGVHATIAGVLVGLMIPVRPFLSHETFLEVSSEKIDALEKTIEEEDEEETEAILGELEQYVDDTISPVERLEYHVRPWVTWVVLPLFALANANIALSLEGIAHAMTRPVTLGIAAGLFLGKPLGTFAFGWIAAKSGIAKLPRGVSWAQIAGIGIIAGIGFTVSIFIANLAYADSALTHDAKLGIVLGSILAAIVGYGFLFVNAKEEHQER